MSNLILSFQVLSYLALGGFIWKFQSILLSTFKVKEHSIAISLAKTILESKDPLQSFILCKGINHSENQTNIAISTKAAMATIFARGDRMIDINLEYITSAKIHLDNIYNRIDELKDDIEIIYLESIDLKFLDDPELSKMIVFLSKTIRKFGMKLILSIPISSQSDLINQNFNSENFKFITLA
ncbi:TPA: hypothetical protein ACY37T_002057 [Pasteurella multocida]